MLPSPLFVLSTLGFFDRTLSSLRPAPAFSIPSRLTLDTSSLSALTSYISGAASGFVKVASDKGTRWRLAFGCWTDVSELAGLCRRRAFRVFLAGPPSCKFGENILIGYRLSTRPAAEIEVGCYFVRW